MHKCKLGLLHTEFKDFSIGSLNLAGQPFSEIRNALPFRDDDEGTALRDEVDAALTTLRENGLVETSRILDISARLIVNRAALKTDPRVAALVEAFRADAAQREAA